MPTPRSMRISYGSLVASSSPSGCKLSLVEVHRTRLGFEDFEVSFQVLLSKPDAVSAADFGTAVATVEAAYRLPYQALLVEWIDPAGVASNVTLLDLKHSDASGLEVRAELSKPGSEKHDTATSRLYEVRITGGLPLANGVREEDYDLTAGANCRRRLVVTGRYTAVNGTAAAAQAQTRIALKSAALLTALSGGSYTDNWKLVANDVRGVSTNDQEAEAVQEWEERLYRDLAGALNDSRLKRVDLKIRRSLPGTQGSTAERGLATMTASWTAELCKDRVTGLEELRDLYQNEVQPWIVANMKLAAPGNFFALTLDEPELEPTDNKISATLAALTTSGGTLLEVDRTETLDVQHGAILKDVWEDKEHIADLKPTPAYVYPGPKQVTFTEELHRTSVGEAKTLRPLILGGKGAQPAANVLGGGRRVRRASASGDSLGAFLGGSAGSKGVKRAVPVTTSKRVKPGVRGRPPHQFSVTTETVTRVTRYVLGVGGGGNNAQPADNRSQERR